MVQSGTVVGHCTAVYVIIHCAGSKVSESSFVRCAFCDVSFGLQK